VNALLLAYLLASVTFVIVAVILEDDGSGPLS
jgi:hypothetical protein